MADDKNTDMAQLFAVFIGDMSESIEKLNTALLGMQRELLDMQQSQVANFGEFRKLVLMQVNSNSEKIAMNHRRIEEIQRVLNGHLADHKAGKWGGL